MKQSEMTRFTKRDKIEISNALKGTGMGDTKGKIMYHFRLYIDFDRCKKYGKQKIKCLTLKPWG